MAGVSLMLVRFVCMRFYVHAAHGINIVDVPRARDRLSASERSRRLRKYAFRENRPLEITPVLAPRH